MDNEMKSKYIRTFKRVYPEPEINIIDIKLFKNNCIMTVEFPDGIFYFVVDDNTISHSYKNFDDAKRETY